MNTNLDHVVLTLLNARKGDWQKVAADSGVRYSWLSKFANGHIGNPGYSTLTKLHAMLSAAPAIPEPEAKAEA